MWGRTAVWIAQGFGIGLMPYGPGTFGSLLGLAWFALLLLIPSITLYFLVQVVSVLVAVWICGVAERVLGEKDPGSVVLDEIAAVPICFTFWVVMSFAETGRLPSPVYFFNTHWMLTLSVFWGFRFFDIVKPWPVRQSQFLPGGWGVSIDDVVAAAYVNGCGYLMVSAVQFWKS